MRIGFALSTWVYNPIRAIVVSKSLTSLAKTDTSGIEKPVLRVTKRECDFNYAPYFEALSNKFELSLHEDPPELNKLLIHQDSGCKLLHEHQDVTHVGFIYDDFYFHPAWGQQLTGLIQRHPDGIAWSIYRSRYLEYHRIIGGDGVDVLMTMHDGTGTIHRDEFLTYSAQYQPGSLDIHHTQFRQGNRWATSKDYMQNLARHTGIAEFDCAIDFIGEVE